MAMKKLDLILLEKIPQQNNKQTTKYSLKFLQILRRFFQLQNAL